MAVSPTAVAGPVASSLTHSGVSSSSLKPAPTPPKLPDTTSPPLSSTTPRALQHYSIPDLLSILRDLSTDLSPLAQGKPDAYLSSDQAARLPRFSTIRRTSTLTLQEVSVELDGTPPRLPVDDGVDLSFASAHQGQAQGQTTMGEELAARIMINFADPFGSAAYLVDGGEASSGDQSRSGSNSGIPTNASPAVPARSESVAPGPSATLVNRYPNDLGKGAPVKLVGVGEKIGVIRLGPRAPSISADPASRSSSIAAARSRTSSISSLDGSPADDAPSWRATAESTMSVHRGFHQSVSTSYSTTASTSTGSINSLRTNLSTVTEPGIAVVRHTSDNSFDSIQGTGSKDSLCVQVAPVPLKPSSLSGSLNPFAVPYLPTRTVRSPVSPASSANDLPSPCFSIYPSGSPDSNDAPAVPLPRTLPASLPSKPGNALPPVFIKRESAALPQPMALPDVAPMGNEWEGEAGMSGNEKRRRASEAQAVRAASVTALSQARWAAQRPGQAKQPQPKAASFAAQAAYTDKMGSWRGRPTVANGWRQDGAGEKNGVKIPGGVARPNYQHDTNRPERLVRLGESLKQTRAQQHA